MGAFTRNSKKFLRWLSKNNYKIYDGGIFNDFAAVFKSDLRMPYSGHFLIKFPFEPFVLQFFEYVPLHKYESLNAEGLGLAKLGIALVIIHDSAIEEKCIQGIPSALFIRIDRVKDRTDIFIGGVRNRKFFFEDSLWRRYLEIKNNSGGSSV